MITQETVRKLFNYEPETGKLTWNYPSSNRIKLGDEVGKSGPAGYSAVRIGGVNYLVHRLIYLYFHGVFPRQVDHINRNRLDNRIENLRESTQSENCGNCFKSSVNTSGFKGVEWNPKNRKWRVKIKKDYKTVEIGSFIDQVDAAQAYNLAAERYFGDYAYFNGPDNSQAWELFTCKPLTTI